MKKLLLLLCLFTPRFAGAQITADSLQSLIRIVQRGMTDSARLSANEILKSELLRQIKIDVADTSGFVAFKNVSVKRSSDQKLTLYTWTVPHYAGEIYDYFGFLRFKNKKENTDTLIELKDATIEVEKPENEKLSPLKWYGAVYYQIVTVKYKKQVYYTLLGWKGKNNDLTEKIIEPLFIEPKQFRFGGNVFSAGKANRLRLIYPYVSMATMTLKYEESKKQIIMDHLSSNSKTVSDGIPFAGPDGTYDALKLKSGRWTLLKDAEVEMKIKPSKELPKPDSLQIR